jgi:phosphonate transport system substrate-binding protein
MPVSFPVGLRPVGRRTRRMRWSGHRRLRPFKGVLDAVLRLTLAVSLVLAGAGCGWASESAGPSYGATASGGEPVYRFAVYPLHNPATLLHLYQPLMDYLNRELGTARLALEASRDYPAFEQKYRSRGPEFILPNPWQTLGARRAGYHVIAQAGDPADLSGVFIVRRDSGIRVPGDLRGKAVSYPAATALAACIMPQMFLYEHGLDVGRDVRNRYVGSQESSIMNAYLGLTAAGATRSQAWRLFRRNHPQEAAELMVIWQTPSLINNSVMARDDVPAGVRDRVRTLLTGLRATTEGRALLARTETTRFLAGDDRNYDIVQKYIDRFEENVRKVESR